MIQLSDHFNFRRLLRFTFPSIAMLTFTSIYGVYDREHVFSTAGRPSAEKFIGASCHFTSTAWTQTRLSGWFSRQVVMVIRLSAVPWR